MPIATSNPAPAAAAGASATPFLDTMPELVAQLESPHGPDDWRARTDQGQEILARKLTVAENEHAPVLDRLRWLAEQDPAGLLRVRGGATNSDGVWALLQPVPGSPLGAVTGAQSLTPAETAAVGGSLFRGLATLHRIGLGQLVVPRTILVDADGKARLDGPYLPVDPAARAGQVRALGETLAQAMGIGVRPQDELTAAERQSPGMVATLRGIAAGSALDATTAAALLEESAGALAAPPQIARSQGELAERVSRLLNPGAAPVRRPTARVRRVPAPPVAVGGAAAAAKAPSPRPMTSVRIGPRMSEKSAWKAKPSPRRAAEGAVKASTVLIGALIGLVLLVGAFSAYSIVTRHRTPVAATTPTPGASTPTPVASPPPVLAPASAPPVSSVALTADQLGTCSPGQSCQVQVRVNFSSGAHTAAWSFFVTDLCTGKMTQVGSGSEDSPFPAYVYADSVVNIPSGTNLQLVAETTSPAVAASPPLKIGPGTC